MRRSTNNSVRIRLGILKQYTDTVTFILHYYIKGPEHNNWVGIRLGKI